MANSRPIFNYNEESQGQKLARKSKDSPFMIIALTLLVHSTRELSYFFCQYSRPGIVQGLSAYELGLIRGILGLLGVCGVGAYKFKTKGKMSTSVFLMQLRVAAQGTVVAALTVGIAYTLAKQHLFKSDKKDE